MCPPFPNYHKLENTFEYKAYQAEVKVYRSLENLKENIIVLHDLVYKIPSDSLENLPKNSKISAEEQILEIDFVVIGKNFVVIIEVSPLSDLDSLELRLDNKMYQAQKHCEMVKRLAQVGDSNDSAQIEWYCAFPNLPKFVKTSLTHQELSKIIFNDHLSMNPDRMNGWWQKNIKDRYCAVPIRNEIEEKQTDRLSKILIGLSNIDSKKSLGESIMITYNKLNRKSNGPPDPLISLKRPLSKNVLSEHEDTIKKELSDMEEAFEKSESEIHAHLAEHEKIPEFDRSWSALRAPVASPAISEKTEREIHAEYLHESNFDNDEIFHQVTGIQKLTKDQEKVVASKENRLLICGPAGSGKTVIIMGKIIQLITRERKRNQPSQKRVLLITNDEEAFWKLRRADPTTHFMRTYDLEDLLIGCTFPYCKRCQGTDKEINTCYRKCFNCPLTSKVFVTCIRDSEYFFHIHKLLSGDFLSEFRGILDTFYVFIDNLHIPDYIRFERYLGKFLHLAQELLSTSLQQDAFIWISCDHALLHYRYIHDYHLHSLLKKFTRISLSNNLRNPVEVCCMLSQIEKVMSPELLSRHVSGNWLHGPRPVIHILKGSELCLIKGKINGEIAKIFDTENKLTFFNRNGSGVAVMLNNLVMKDEVTKFMKTKSLEKDPIIVVNIANNYDRFNCAQDFPAVIVLMDASILDLLEELYFAISRAVVYCSVILYNYKETSDKDLDYLLQYGFREMTKPELRPKILFN